MSYVSKLSSTGALRKTPKRVIEAMLNEAGHRSYNIIVEIGAGNGELTRALLQSSNISFDRYHAFEIDRKACDHLLNQFPCIKVHQEDAFRFSKHLFFTEEIDFFVSSIPLSFYSREKVACMLTEAKNRLAPNGKIVIIFSAIWLIPFLKKQLQGSRITPFVTFPPYFILSYHKKS